MTSQRDDRFRQHGFQAMSEVSPSESKENLKTIAGVQRKKVITLRRSPHVNKKHRDQFWMSTGTSSRIVWSGYSHERGREKVHRLQEDLSQKRLDRTRQRNRDIESRVILNTKTQ